MDIKFYRKFLNEYVSEAVKQSDGSVRQIAERLHEQQVKGLFVSHREEKQRALSDAQKAFDEHGHWPLEIILNFLDVTVD